MLSDVKDKITDLKIKGLGFETEENRFYPEGSTAAQLLGFVGKNDEGDDTGYFGLEGYYNISLTGRTGFQQRKKDLSGSPLLSEGLQEINSIPGTDLHTYIDKRILERSVEAKLEQAKEKNGANKDLLLLWILRQGESLLWRHIHHMILKSFMTTKVKCIEIQ